MDKIFRLKDSFIQFLSPPSKRRRTVPATPTLDEEHHYHTPASEPQAAIRINQQYRPPAGIKNPRKRALEESDDGNTEVTESAIGPEDSVSQSYRESESEGGLEVGEDAACGIIPVAVIFEEDGDSGSVSADEGDVEDESELEDELVLEDELELVDDGASKATSEDGDEVEQELGQYEDELGSHATSEDSDAVEEQSDVEEEEEPEVSPEAKVQEYLARQAELALRIQDIEKVKAAGDFHEGEVFLYERLAMRSFEELLPSAWKIDFRALPEGLFTEKPERQFINTNCTSPYSGVRALQPLLSMGNQIRANSEHGRPTEPLILRECKSYIKWSERDGGYLHLRFLPVLNVVAARNGQSIDSLSANITNQLAFLAKQHREQLVIPSADGEIQYRRPPPLLYGIIIAQTMVIFVTLNSADPDAKIRHLQHFDLSQKDMVVWNGFAIAIIVIVARNYLMSIKDEFEEDDPPSDPDL